MWNCHKETFKTLHTLVKGISKNNFRDLLNLATKESFFRFNNNFFIQVDGVAMGSPLGTILSNIIISHHEENWLSKCPINLNQVLIESMLMIFLYILHDLNLAARFANICPLKIRT